MYSVASCDGLLVDFKNLIVFTTKERSDDHIVSLNLSYCYLSLCIGENS